MYFDRNIQVERETSSRLREVVKAYIKGLLLKEMLTKAYIRRNVKQIASEIVERQNSKIILAYKLTSNNLVPSTSLQIRKLKKEVEEIILENLDHVHNQVKKIKEDNATKKKAALLLLLLLLLRRKSDIEIYKKLSVEEIRAKVTELQIEKELNGLLKDTTQIIEYANGKAHSDLVQNVITNNDAMGYIWVIQNDNKVRDGHKDMQSVFVPKGVIPMPNLTSKYPNKRKRHPGEDYNCRCYKIAIFNEKQLRTLFKGKAFINEKITRISLPNLLKKIGVK